MLISCVLSKGIIECRLIEGVTLLLILLGIVWFVIVLHVEKVVTSTLLACCLLIVVVASFHGPVGTLIASMTFDLSSFTTPIALIRRSMATMDVGGGGADKR